MVGQTATYLRNQSLTRANLEALTPHEKFTGKKPDLSNVRTFGCKVFVHINNPKMGKLYARAVEGVLLGYGKNTKRWIINVLSTKKTIISWNIEFFEKINKLPIKVSIGSSKRKDPKLTAVQPTTAPSPKKPEPKQVVIPSSLKPQISPRSMQLPKLIVETKKKATQMSHIMLLRKHKLQ